MLKQKLFYLCEQHGNWLLCLIEHKSLPTQVNKLLLGIWITNSEESLRILDNILNTHDVGS